MAKLNEQSFVLKGIKALGVLLPGAMSSWLTYSKYAIDHDLFLPKAIETERKTFKLPGFGHLSYYVDESGQGRPIVLIHSINAAPSAFEMKSLFERYRGQRPVYALDLPGFGFSDRPTSIYTPELYAQAITAFVEGIVKEEADVVGLSLGCEFIARASVRRPDLFHSLVMLTPTGFDKSIGEFPSEALYRFFSFPLWSQALFDLLVTYPSIRYFLKQSFGTGIPEDFAHYAYLTAHQPGAKNAPLHFISGLLFTWDVLKSFYSRLQVPVLVLYGFDPNVGFDQLEAFASENDHWHTVYYGEDVGLPHWDRLHETVQHMDDFYAGLADL